MFLKSLFYFIVISHTIIIFLNLSIVFAIPFLEPWYIALPIITLLVNLMFSPIPCPLTRLECVVRRNLGMPEIRHFVGHYFIHPVRQRIRKMRTH